MSLNTVFLSHSAKEPDHGVTETLARALGQIGIEVWWDKDGLEGGDFFPVEILEAIIRQHWFMFVISPNAVNSKWCLRELIRATELGKPVIPLLLTPVPDERMPLELAGLQYLRLDSGVDDAVSGILRALGVGPVEAHSGDDPFARDGRLLAAIARALSYATTFTDALNMVLLLQNLGRACCETDRARMIIDGMQSDQHFRGGGGMRRISFDEVARYLLKAWRQ